MSIEPATRQRPSFARSAPADAQALARVRHVFTRWLADADVDQEIVSDLAVAFSELVTNAAEAAGDLADEPVETRAWLEDHAVVLEVANPVPSSRHLDRWDLDDPLRSGGRGLMIVQAYTDAIEVDVREQTLVVRCLRHLADRRQAERRQVDEPEDEHP